MGKKNPITGALFETCGFVTQLVVAPSYSVVSEFFLGNYSSIA